MDHKEIDVNTRNWIDSAQDRNYWRVLVDATLKPGSIGHVVRRLA
jgi:hypothetical protein